VSFNSEENSGDDHMGDGDLPNAAATAQPPQRGIPEIPPFRSGLPPEVAIPGPMFQTLKDALLRFNETEHGTVLVLDASQQHGPYEVVHDYPEEHPRGRVWADLMDMRVPCSILGSQPGTRWEPNYQCMHRSKRGLETVQSGIQTGHGDEIPAGCDDAVQAASSGSPTSTPRKNRGL
jgi:hypothetical protein